MNKSREPWLTRLPALFEISAPNPERARRRIALMECNIMLPAKIFIIALIQYSFSYSPWTGSQSQTDVVVETVQKIFWFYIFASAFLAIPLLAVRRLPLAVGQWATVTNSLIDAVFLAAMTVVTGGLDSILFWLFIGLILRNALSVPPGISQLILSFLASLCYAGAVMLDVSVLNGGDESAQRIFDLSLRADWAEPFVLRLVVLWLTMLCCGGLELLLERQRQAAEEAAEFAARESQLQSAGRLAAEFAHQIKNPLAIINNATHSLQRSLVERRPVNAEHIDIIREEVARVDQVIKQIMGYAQMSEERVKKLEVVKSIEAALGQIFPPALPTGIKVKKNYAGNIPPLLMQRGHLMEILLNLLKNAREALGDKGTVTVTADQSRDHAVEISVADDGPGVPPERLGQVFEAYFTTKNKGTGLGLAIVKHNVELYGGTVRVESKHGKGAKFTLVFPAKSQPRPIVP